MNVLFFDVDQVRRGAQAAEEEVAAVTNLTKDVKDPIGRRA